MIYLGIIIGLGVLIYSQKAKGAETVDNSDSRFDSLFIKYGKMYNIVPKELKAIATIESSLGRAKSVDRGLKVPSDIEGSKSSDGLSWGLMQVTLTTARDYDSQATPELLNNPDYSVKIASQHLSKLHGLFDRTDARYQEWVIKSYNQGQGNTLREKRGLVGYANGYWLKYLNAYTSLGDLSE